MKTTHLFTISLLLVAVMACTKKDNQEAAQAPSGSMASSETPMEVMPAKAEVEPAEMLPNEIKPGDTTTPIEQNKSGKKVIFWYDPMLPDRHFSKAGQSPFMDMKLAPQYEVDTNKGGTP